MRVLRGRVALRSIVTGWLERIRQGRGRHGLSAFLRREMGRWIGRSTRPLRREHLRAALERVGVAPGITLCVHSSLSRFGYVDGGATAIIDVILDLVGPDGTVLMPSFPTGGSTYEFLASGGVFDVRTSPSKVGLITEEFRRRPDVSRSLHPTNPVAAWGARADEYLRDHEKSETAYGHDTPFGRLARDRAARILMMETHIHSFLHHLQERVELPGLFLDRRMPATTIDAAGRRHVIEMKVTRPRVTYFVAVPSLGGVEPDWAILHDYALVFPPSRDREIRSRGYTFPGFPVIWSRRAQFVRQGILRATAVRGATIGALAVQPFVAAIEPEFRELIRRFAKFYDPERIAARNLPYL
jgi:aminoglycoside N3'-acetyltransferase